MKTSSILSAGVALFAMLFGAGNVVLSLALGRDAGSSVGYALAGFMVGAILIPLVGLIAAILCDSDYKKLLGRVGVIPSTIVTMVCMVLIGPFGCIPRCVATSYASVKPYVPDCSILLFSIVASILIFLCTIRRNGVIDLLGKYLGPIKLTLLMAIIVKGLFSAQQLMAPVVESSALAVMSQGLFMGYGTLDLLAMIFFAGFIVGGLKKSDESIQNDPKKLVIVALKAGLVAALLLGIVYAGFCIVAALYAPLVGGVDKYELLNTLAPLILGSQLGFIANITVAISCLATAIGITTVFTSYLCEDLLKGKVNYVVALGFTTVLTGLMTNLGFRGIMMAIMPLVDVFYPALIALSLFTIIQRWAGVLASRVAFFVTLAAVAVWQYFI